LISCSTNSTLRRPSTAESLSPSSLPLDPGTMPCPVREGDSLRRPKGKPLSLLSSSLG
jgi:hypothetical protein